MQTLKQTKTARRRVLSVLLTLMMVLSLIPLTAVPAYAAATGTINIGTETGLTLTTDQSGTGWTWAANSDTLTLYSTYTHEPIAIDCGLSDDIKLEYNGDVSVTSAGTHAIFCKGNLTIISSGNGTLALEYTGSDSYSGLTTYGSLTISSNSKVNASSSGTNGEYNTAEAIYGERGVTIGDTANVTATVTGTNASGITAASGNINISTSGTVTANCTGEGFALFIYNPGHSVNISGGAVNLTGNPVSNAFVTIASSATVNASDSKNQLYLVTLDGMAVDTSVTNVSAPAGYHFANGSSPMRTNSAGEVCFWLPAGSQTVKLEADPYNYTVTTNVTADHANTAAMTALAPNTVISIVAIPGVTPPVTGATPVTSIETAEYTGTVGWVDASNYSLTGTFAASTVYTAYIVLTPKPGFTRFGVAENFFTVAGATSVINPAGASNISLAVTAVFPATVAAGGGGGGGGGTPPGGGGGGGTPPGGGGGGGTPPSGGGTTTPINPPDNYHTPG
jgi:hypothetical protein